MPKVVMLAVSAGTFYECVIVIRASGRLAGTGLLGHSPTAA